MPRVVQTAFGPQAHSELQCERRDLRPRRVFANLFCCCARLVVLRQEWSTLHRSSAPQSQTTCSADGKALVARRTWFRPPRLATYSASSARPYALSKSLPAVPQHTPKLAVTLLPSGRSNA